MPISRSTLIRGATIAGAIGIAAVAYSCRANTKPSLITGDASSKVYVAPGQYDEFYAFMSGGFNGQVSVYGLPSGRMLKLIPVFSQHAENGWGYNEETKPMLQTTLRLHPVGRRPSRRAVADRRRPRRPLALHQRQQHAARRAHRPHAVRDGRDPRDPERRRRPRVAVHDAEHQVHRVRHAVQRPDPEQGRLDRQLRRRTSAARCRSSRPISRARWTSRSRSSCPGFNYDLGHAGKGPSDGWFFFTSYNSEQAYTKLEANASKNDKDFIAAMNYAKAESCVAEGKAKAVPVGVHAQLRRREVAHRALGDEDEREDAQPERLPGTRLLPPDAQVAARRRCRSNRRVHRRRRQARHVIPVHSFTKMQKAIADKAFETTIDGIPVLKYEAVLAGEVQKPGLGPLHTEFDGKGYAYTSMFISSEIVKWKLGTWEVVDRVPTYYSIGHLMIPGGDSRQPFGKYVVAMNKITKDRYLPTGAELTQSAQLYDISGDKMKLLLDFPTIGEPHYAQALPAAMIRDKQIKFFSLKDNANPTSLAPRRRRGFKRTGKRVDVKMIAIRSHFAPDNIEGVQQGDTVYFHVTNLEQDWDILHGFAVLGAENAELIMQPGETRTLKWIPKTPGIFPFYCTDFCSALHQEMQGYVRVVAAWYDGRAVTATTSKKAQSQTRTDFTPSRGDTHK